MNGITGKNAGNTGSPNELTEKTNEYSSAMLECFDGYLYICTHDFKLEYCNMKCKELTGGDSVGRNCYESIYRMNTPCPWCKYTEVQSGETMITEIVNPTDSRWYRVSQSRVVHSDGTISMINIVGDIDKYVNRDRNSVGVAVKAEKMSIDMMADAIAIFDIRGNLLDLNAQATVLTGYTTDELRGHNITEMFADSELADNPLRFDLIARGDVVRNERNMKCKDGSTICVESRSVIMPDGRFQCIIRDISSRKIVEESLQYSEEKFKKVFRISPDAICISRFEDGVFLDVNNCFLNLTGYAEHEVLGRTAFVVEFSAWMDLCDRERFIELLEKNGEVNCFDTSLRRKNGSVFYGTISARVIDYKKERCLVSIIRDMTEKKKQNDILEQNEKKYRELANSIPLGIFEADLSGKVTFANLTAYEWFGYTQEDFDKGVNIREIVVPEQRKIAVENIRNILIGNKPHPHEYNVLRKNGTVFPSLFMSNPIVDSEGKINGIRGSIVDMTERKNIEIALQNTQKLESVGVLAGGIAHDFNNLLAGIFSYLDLGHEFIVKNDIGNAMECIEKAMSVFERARSLTHQLLTFSKGGMPDKKTISLAANLEEIVQFSLSGSCVKAIYKIDMDMWQCDVDMHQIEQVIDNLVINARQAMPDGGQLTISAGNAVVENNAIPVLENGRYVIVSIEDTGTGIPEEIIPRIFDPFFTTKAQGNGLGLATTYSIIKKHGGNIFVESKAGVGTKFTIYLPAVTVKAEPVAVVEEIETAIEGYKILVMDDESFIRDVCKFAIQEINCQIVTVSNAHEAIKTYIEEKISGTPFDLVILDLTIPGSLGGLQVLELIRNVDPDVCAIASSGYSDDPVMSDPQKYGFAAKLSKPYLKNNIQDIVRRTLSKEKKRGADVKSEIAEK